MVVMPLNIQFSDLFYANRHDREFRRDFCLAVVHEAGGSRDVIPHDGKSNDVFVVFVLQYILFSLCVFHPFMMSN